MKHLSANLLQGSTIQEQIERETEAVREGVKRYHRMVREATERGDAASLKPVERLEVHWFKPLVAAIKAEARACVDAMPQDVVQELPNFKDIPQRAKGRVLYGPAIRLIDAKRMAVITMNEALKHCLLNPDGAIMSKLTYQIGNAIIAEANMDLLKKDAKHNTREVRKIIQHMSPREAYEFRHKNTSNLAKLTKVCRNLTTQKVNWWAKKSLEDNLHRRKVCMQLGMAMCWLLIGVAAAGPYDEDEFTPAFLHKNIWEAGKKVGILLLTDDALAIIEEGHSRRETLRPIYSPMITTPAKWQDGRGGYYTIETWLTSKPSTEQRRAQEDADLSTVYEGIDALNSCPCRINKYILDIQRQVWEEGGGFARIPRANDYPFPPKLDNPNEEQLNQAKKERGEIFKRNRGLKGERAYYLQTLRMAQSVADREAFWQVHQLDFRGRAYPITPGLNSQGADEVRALFELGVGKAVTDRGRRWLKIHLAGMLKFDNVNTERRIEYIDQRIDKINSWVEAPLQNTGWLLKFDGTPNKKKQWQVLAAAHALFNDDAAAHLPIQVDGKCNGLQHYAAMLRDPVAAKAVCLMPGDEPEDVYRDAADVVEPRIKADAMKGKVVAELVMDRVPITRDLTKDVVMPSVYGVTAVGAREAMYESIEDCGFEDRQKYEVSKYLGNVVMESLNTVCPSTVDAMNWLAKCARLIVNKSKEPVKWVSPVGLPVVQSYRRTKETYVATVMQKMNLQFYCEKQPVAKDKQIDAFPPNFIHSIDSAHLMFTAIECRRRGIDMLTVHDSYWTHAEDCDEMGEVLREQFVELHSEPLLSKLHAEFTKAYPKVIFPDPPKIGDFGIEMVKDSPYFFN